MGSGKRLKEILDEKHMKVAELARLTKMNKQTLYNIINRDSDIRFDFAFRIANVLDIDVSEICKSDVFVSDEVLPEQLKAKTEKGEEKLKRDWAKNRSADIFVLFEYKQLPQIDKLLLDYFVLNDEGRKDVRKYIDYQLIQNKDKDREQKRKEII